MAAVVAIAVKLKRPAHELLATPAGGRVPYQDALSPAMDDGGPAL